MNRSENDRRDKVPISGGPVQVYLLRDADPAFDALEERWRGTLSPAERDRAGRYRFPRHARQSRLAHALKRHALSWHLPRIAPADWRFELTDHGKPYVAGAADAPVFNLSHSDGMIALAVAPPNGAGPCLGVDVEAMNRTVSEGVAERFFAAREVADLRALPNHAREERFFALWALKESYIKAVGLGLGIPLDSFAFRFTGADRRSLSFRADREERPEDWAFRQTVVPRPGGGGHSLALACGMDDQVSRMEVAVNEITPDGEARPQAVRWLRTSAATGA
ncbi:4'-phosphopantetheinyl transferase family protein [Stappia stellulata]|uniref:4'-phosphopantetheinyl transferase family protein n=1 Tax=Stappia stellulata TaxID=71235 RepID=UPI0004294839|nr:4'-phosphopantetheinyl transferase superfamily protein [Stappia stellulata]